MNDEALHPDDLDDPPRRNPQGIKQEAALELLDPLPSALAFDYSAVKLAVAIPTKGNVSVQTMASVFSLIAKSIGRRVGELRCQGRGFHVLEHGMGVAFLSSQARTCPEARSQIVHEFLLAGEPTHLLFVDGDIEFAPETILRMIAVDRAVVGCGYKCSVEAVGTYNLNVETLPGSWPDEQGCMKVAALGLGLTLIKREALVEMTRHYGPELTYAMPINGGREWRTIVALFHEPIQNGSWLGEDFAFFTRWRALGPGHDVELFLDAPITHHHNATVRTVNALEHLEALMTWSRAKSQYWPLGDTPVPCEDWRREIRGWSDDILPWTREIVASLPEDAHCVEVGVFHGRSLIFLAEELTRQGKSRAHVWGFDPGENPQGRVYDGPEDDAVQSSTMWDSRAALLMNLRRTAGERGIALDAIAATSPECAANFGDESLDLVFIDGDHRYGAVSADLDAWIPKVKPGGILAGHDYYAGGSSFPGVHRAVVEHFGDCFEPGTDFIRGGVQGTVWWVRRALDSVPESDDSR